MLSIEPRDVFIAYTKGDPFESGLVEALKDQLYRWGLTVWVYEDWDWETDADSGPRWRSHGSVEQLDPIRYAMRHPQPFQHRKRGPVVDREVLAWMFEQSGAVVVVAGRAHHVSPGARIELEVLEREAHPPVARVLWAEHALLARDIPSFFDYKMRSDSPRDFSVPAESLARAAWLACMMARLSACGPMGHDVARQLARSDGLLNLVAKHAIRPLNVPFDADATGNAVVPEVATAADCAPVLAFWKGGPGFTADWLTSGKPPQDIIEASKTMRALLRHWCETVVSLFPALAEPTAAVNLPLGAAMLRIGKTREAIETITEGLAAADARPAKSSLLLNRALAWTELGARNRAIEDYTLALDDDSLRTEMRAAVLYNRAILWNESGRFTEAERDLDEVLSMPSLPVRIEALALVSRALAKYKTNRLEEAIADYDRITKLKKAPVEARLKALLNRGALRATLGRHLEAIGDYDAVLAMREATPRQHALALFNRADASTQLGDRDAARRDYQAALNQPELDDDLAAHIEQRLAALNS